MSANFASSLFVRLGLDSSEYTKGLDKAQYQAERFAQQQQVVGTAIGVTLAGAFMAAGRAIVQTVSSTLSLQANLKDLTTQSGMAVGTLDGLRKVGLLSATSVDTIAMASTRLTRALQNQDEDSRGAAQAIKALGLDFKTFKAMGADEQLMAVAKAMSGFRDGTEKSNAAMLLFRQTGPQFLKFLKELAERGVMVSSVTEESAAQSKAYQDNVVLLGLALDDFKQELAVEVFPWLVKITSQLLTAKDAFGSFASGLWSAGSWNPFKPFRENSDLLKEASADVEKYQKQVDDIQANLNANQTLGQLGKNIVGGYTEDAEKIALSRLRDAQRAKAAYLKAQQEDALAAGAGITDRFTQQAPRLSIQNPERGSKAARKSEAQQYLESLQRQLATVEELTAAQRLELEIRKGMEGLTPSIEKQLRLDAAGLDQARERQRIDREWQAAQKSADADRERELKAQADSVESIRSQNAALALEIKLMGASSVERARLEDEKLSDTIATKENTAAALEARMGDEERIALLRLEIKALRDRRDLRKAQVGMEWQAEVDSYAAGIVDAAADDASKSMSESIAQGIMDGFRQGKSFADVFIDELKAQFAKTVLAPIIKPMVETGNNVIGSIMDFILNLPGAAAGGGSGNPTPIEFQGPRAGGGPVSPNSLYRVNELRTEALRVNGEGLLLTGSQGGTIDSAPARAGGGPSIYQTLNIGQGVSRNELASAMVAAKEAAKSEILRSMRTNGAFA